MPTTGQATGRYVVTPTTPTGQATGYYQVIPVGISDLPSGGGVRQHVNLTSTGGIAGIGQATGHYRVIPVGISDLPSGGGVRQHANLTSTGGIAGIGQATGHYRVIERPKVTTVLPPIRDAFVWDKEPYLNYGDVEDIAAGRSGGYLTRGMVQFDVSTLRTDLTILSAVLRLRCRFVGSGEIGVYPLLGTWDELGVTWLNQPSVYPIPVATQPAPAQVRAVVDFDITSLFLGWYQGTRANYGVGLRMTDEATMAATLFGAREAGTDWQPQLLVTYYEPDALAEQNDLSSAGLVNRTELVSLGYVYQPSWASYELPTSGNVNRPHLPSTGLTRQVSSLATLGYVRGASSTDLPASAYISRPELPSSGKIAATGRATGLYTVIPVGFSDISSSGDVRQHVNLSSSGKIAATGRATGLYTVIESPTKTTALSPIRDAFVWDKKPYRNYGNVQDIAAGRSGGYLARGLVQFDVSTLRTGLTILSATLRLRCRFVGSGEIGVYPLLGAWDELGVTWLNQPPASPIAEATASAPTQVGGTIDLDITGLFLGWYRGTRTNYGVGLRVTDETMMAATFFGAREAGADWQPQLLVTYYEPDALADQNDLSSAGRVSRTDLWELVSLGQVDAPIHMDPCSAPTALLWQGPYANLMGSPYPPSVSPPPMAAALARAYMKPRGEICSSLQYWGEYQGYPAFVLLGASFCSATHPVGLAELQNKPNQYEVQAWVAWHGNSPDDSPYRFSPWHVTGWVGQSYLGSFVPGWADSWYLHAYVYPPTGAPCGLPSGGNVNQPGLPSAGLARQVSSLATLGYVRGASSTDLPAVAAVSRSVLSSTGRPRVPGWEDQATAGYVAFRSELPSSGSLQVAGMEELASGGYVAHAPNELSSTGAVKLFNDLDTTGTVGMAPNQLPSTGTPRVFGTVDLNTRGFPNTPWLASQGAVHIFSTLGSRGWVQISNDLASQGMVTFSGLGDIVMSGWPRIRDASDLLSTAQAKAGTADLGSRGIVTAIVLEINIDLRAWPPEGRSAFPQ